jgi:ABC-type uncharacterized transport system substrate-binding protein
MRIENLYVCLYDYHVLWCDFNLKKRKGHEMNGLRTTGICFVGFLLIVGLFGASSAMGQGKVLLVHSYHSGYPWVDSITEGVKKGLEGSGAQLEIFYMDTKRKTGDAWKEESGKLAKAKVDEFQPDVVITTDDNAQAYFAKDYAGKEKPSIVFCGVNAKPEKYGFPADNVTGILERPHLVDTVQMMLAIKSDIKKIGILTDKSPTSDAVVEYIKTLEMPGGVQIVSYDQPETFDQWQATIQKYQNSVDAFGINMYHTVKKTADAETSMEPADVISWTMQNNQLPTFGFFPFCIEDGCLCGIVESGEEHGFESAQIAVGIINGKSAKDFPVKLAKRGMVMLNAKTAEKLGVTVPFEIIQSTDKVIE